MTVQVDIDGLADATEFFRRMPDISTKAASLAINQVSARNALPSAVDEMYSQIAFPKGYLNGDRIGVTKYAKESDLESIITARKRATSLARFAKGAVIGRAGISVEVQRGNTTSMKGAWLVRLKKGASISEDRYNVGLAVRVKPGEKIVNKRGQHHSWLIQDRVALLYGPSVDQVFRDVADEISPGVANALSREFYRQFERLSK